MPAWRLRDYHDGDLDQAIGVWDQSRGPGAAEPVFSVAEVMAAARRGNRRWWPKWATGHQYGGRHDRWGAGLDPAGGAGRPLARAAVSARPLLADLGGGFAPRACGASAL